MSELGEAAHLLQRSVNLLEIISQPRLVLLHTAREALAKLDDIAARATEVCHEQD